MHIVVTGGAGYIGSHATQRLLKEGHRVTVIDNLVRGNRGAMKALACDDLRFIEGDLGDEPVLADAFSDGADAVLHFGALAYVGESVEQPLRYYRNNAASGLSLLEKVIEVGVPRFVFSSTCATYGEPSPEFIPIPETCPQRPINPYGVSKLHLEHMLFDAQRALGDAFSFAALRYFNVAGCDRSGVLGEDHRPETHLIPVVIQAALGQRDHVTIFGTDYETEDGTCVRDYVHVEDLVDAHVAVLGALRPGDARTYNLGIGNGYSVRQIIDATKRVTGTDFEVREGERRPGDPPKLYGDPSKIQREIGWNAQVTDLDEIIDSAWQWMRRHPDGYAT